MSGPESILVASILRHFPSLISRLGSAPAQPECHRQKRPFGKFRSYTYPSCLERPYKKGIARASHASTRNTGQLISGMGLHITLALA